MHPSGPQPPRVYWVRRALVLVVVLVLLLGVRWLLGGRGSSDPAALPDATKSPAASQSPATSPTATRSASATAKPSTTPTPTPTAKPTTKPTTPAATPECTNSQIAVTASTDAASYPVGSTPHLRMKIENTSKKACTRDIGAAQNELVITSGSSHVWSSDDCNPGGSPQVATLAPGQSYSVAVTWLGKLSQKGCPTGQPSATQGSYKLIGRNGTVLSASAGFALT